METHILFVSIPEGVNAHNTYSLLDFLKSHLHLPKLTCEQHFFVGPTLDLKYDVSLWEFKSESKEVFVRVESDQESGQVIKVTASGNW